MDAHHSLTRFIFDCQWAVSQGPGVSILELLAGLVLQGLAAPLLAKCGLTSISAPSLKRVMHVFSLELISFTKAFVGSTIAQAFGYRARGYRLKALGFPMPVSCAGVFPEWSRSLWQQISELIVGLRRDVRAGTASMVLSDGAPLPAESLRTGVPFPWLGSVEASTAPTQVDGLTVGHPFAFTCPGGCGTTHWAPENQGGSTVGQDGGALNATGTDVLARPSAPSVC